MVLTPYTLAALPRGAGTGAIRKALEKADVAAKWESSSWAKKLAARDQRKKQNDFERFEIGLLKRQRRDLVRKATAKEKKAATA
jgi:large subunit ribosomal protein L14e